MDSLEDTIIKKYLEGNAGRKPSILYHYTSIEGLIAIIESKCIWASSIQYLNDKEEFVRTIKLIRKTSNKYFKDDKELSKLFSRSKILNDLDIYVTSLTENG